jgi:predicted aspartyl protease
LNQLGAFIEVTITHPRIVQENFKQQGKSAPTVSVKALIDTGASGTVITPRVASQLSLVQTGFQKVSSVQDEQERPVYYGFIIFPWGSGKEIPIVSCPLKNFDCLIGRDILLHWHFTYNGPDGSVVICD